jgi:hypothetical protein
MTTRLVNPAFPTKVYVIRDAQWRLIGEIAADTAHQALEYALIDWGPQCRTAVISDVKMPGVRKLKY